MRNLALLPLPFLTVVSLLVGGLVSASDAIGANQAWASDLAWSAATSGWGPIEKDRSNGESAAGDGHALTIAGHVYAKGLGAHAPSDIRYALNGAYVSFQSDVGVDDEVSSRGSVVFQILVDGVKRYDSGTLTGAMGHQSTSVDLTGAKELRLVITDAGDTVYFDHADWAGANLAKAPIVAIPAAPSNLTATATSSSTIALAWADHAGNETGFAIQRSLDGVTFTPRATAGANATSWVDAGLSGSTTCWYRVAAANAAGASAFTAPASATTPAAAIAYAAPITITAGGTYTGSWQTANGHAAITIATSSPVTLRGCNVRGTGDLIASSVDHCKLTVVDTVGQGLDAWTDTRFIDVEAWDHLVVDHCTLDGTSGIYAAHYAGNRTAQQTALITGNRARNIIGSANDLLQFFQMNHDLGLVSSEVAWNQIVNEPGKSQVEDNISLYESTGTAASPIRIHDNYVQGGYARDPVGADYSGGGIMAGDGQDGLSGYIDVAFNQVVSTSNYGIAISSGHDSAIHDNRILSCGLLADGRRIPYQNVGLYIWDSYHTGRFPRNTGTRNQIGWILGSGRNDSWTPDAASYGGQIAWPGSITLATEAAEYQAWIGKLANAGRTVGARR